MRPQKAKISFKAVKDAELTELCQHIVDEMTLGVAFFPTPVPALATVQAAIDDYENKLTDAIDGSKAEKTAKKLARKVLEGLMNDLGNYVNFTAGDDLNILTKSAFPLSKVPGPVGVLPPPASFKITFGDNPGEMKFSMSTVPKASGYLVIYTQEPAPADEKLWQAQPSSQRSGMITGLESNKKYTFKAAATSPESNKSGNYNYTEPVSKLVQ